MPRPTRRTEDAAAVAQRTARRRAANVALLRSDGAAEAGGWSVHHTTPTRLTQTQDLTAGLPPSMLETPPHAPFLTTPNPLPNDLETSSDYIPRPARNARNHHQLTPAAPATTPVNQDNTHISSHTLGSPGSEAVQDEQSLIGSILDHTDDARQLVGLREISSLATWTLSSAKPGCALAQLRHPSPSQFWQSDGPQPHTLTLHFFKLVSIVKMRIYLDFKLDESYTPTKMRFFAGMSEGRLVEFGQWEVEESTDLETGEPTSAIENIRGWIDVSLRGVGGHDPSYYEAQEARRLLAYERQNRSGERDMMDIDSEDEEALAGGDVLRAMVVQVRICENHQNGKDTHVRGFQVFAKDEVSLRDMRKVVKRPKRKSNAIVADCEGPGDEVTHGLQPASWMAEPDIR